MAESVSVPGVQPRRAFALPAVLERQGVLGPVMVAPAILYIAILVGYPFFLALYLSISDLRTGSSGLGNFVGLDNFVNLAQNSIFIQALTNTLLFTIVSAVGKGLLGTVLAFLLAENLPGTRAFRVVIMLPWTIPIALSAITWKWLLDSQYSIINWLTPPFGQLPGKPWPIWLGEPTLAIASVIGVNIWRGFPFAAIILLAGMTSIPQDIIDAAKVDGASFLTRYRRIIIPMIAPILFIGSLYDLVFTLTDMSVVYLLTAGGPDNRTHVLATWAFQVGILSGALSRGAAVALFLFPFLLVIVFFVLRALRRREW